MQHFITLKSLVGDLSPSLSWDTRESIDSYINARPTNSLSKKQPTPYIEVVETVQMASSVHRKEILNSIIFRRSLSVSEIEDTMLWSVIGLGFPSVMAALADLTSIVGNDECTSVPLPQKSKVMDLLYGEVVADQVFARLESISRKFNVVAQRIAYDKFWAESSLSLKIKSLITITSLVLIGREEQLKIHLNGFQNVGGSYGDCLRIVNRLDQNHLEYDREKALVQIGDVFSSVTLNEEVGLSALEEEILLIVIGILNCDRVLLNRFSEKTINEVARHLSVYAGSSRVHWINSRELFFATFST